VVAMVQYDRQWQVMQQTNRLLAQQTTDLARIRRLLEQGISVAGPTSRASSQNPYLGMENVLKAQAQPDYAQGDDLVDTFLATPAKLTPLVSTDLASWVVQSYVMDTLATQDFNTLVWTPRLAVAWKVSDDQLTMDFELRHGVTFSDGSPFTADDVVF